MSVRTDLPECFIGTAKIAAKSSSHVELTSSAKVLLSQAAAGGTFMLTHSHAHPLFKGDGPAMMREGPADSTPQQGKEYTAR